MADTPHTFNSEGARRIVNATRRVEGMPQTMPPTYRRRNKAVPRGNGAAPDPTGPTANGFIYICKDTYVVSDGSEEVLIGFENVNMVGREFDLAMFDVADQQPWSPREWHPVDCCEDAFEVVATLDLGDGLRADIGVDGADGGQLKIVGVGGTKFAEVKVVGQISCKSCPECECDDTLGTLDVIVTEDVETTNGDILPAGTYSVTKNGDTPCASDPPTSVYGGVNGGGGVIAPDDSEWRIDVDYVGDCGRGCWTVGVTIESDDSFAGVTWGNHSPTGVFAPLVNNTMGHIVSAPPSVRVVEQ
jgi:hypothetical protein